MERADSISLLFLRLFRSLVETRMLAEIKQSFRPPPTRRNFCIMIRLEGLASSEQEHLQKV